MRWLLVLMLMLGAFVWCPFAVSEEPAPRVFQVRGTVEVVRPGSSEVDIFHEEIPGYMQAMSMPFRVRDQATLTALRPGQYITFRLMVTRTDDWLEEPVVIREPVFRAPLTHDGVPAPQPTTAAELKLLKIGDVVPDLAFTTERSDAATLSAYRGHALAVTFVFTRCPLPSACPLLSRRFREVQDLLAARPASSHRLLSLTIDPDHDTVAVLATYAAALGADRARWRFGHANLPALTLFSAQLGLGFWQADGTIRHNLRTLVLDPHGRLHVVREDGRWSAAELVQDLEQAAAVPAP